MDCVQTRVKVDVFTEAAAFRMPPRVVNGIRGTHLTGHTTQVSKQQQKAASAAVPGMLRVAGGWQEGDSVPGGRVGGAGSADPWPELTAASTNSHKLFWRLA